MRLFQHLLFALALCGMTSATHASPSNPVSGTDYITLSRAQNTDAVGKVEVIEFFSYQCPHCYGFEPLVAAWVKANADKIVFKRVHVGHTATEAALQRAYVTFEAMGVADQVHQKLFDAIHVERERLVSDAAIVEWLPKAGVARAKFQGVANSFGITSRINRAREKVTGYQIDQWPMIAIGGRYLTSPYTAGGKVVPELSEPEQQLAAIQVMNYLLLKARTEIK